MKTLILLVLVVACGKKDNSKECRNREHMQMECQATNTPNYGRPYAQDMCSRTYSVDKCY
jgi:major membrane immunogen (membrane-anchored lipoprotein)